MTIKIQTLKKGSVFFECESGYNDEYVAVSDPFRDHGDSGWAIDGYRTDDGEVIRFFANDKYPGYAPKLYNEEQY